MMDGNIILSVAKAMEVLQILSQAESPLSLKELATRCGYPKSTVFGLLTTMRAYDVAAQTPDGKYTLGLRLLWAASGAVLGHLTGGPPLYGAPVPADRGVRYALGV